MVKMKADQVQQKIQQAADQAVPKLRHIDEIEVGQAIRQGDIYVTRLERMPRKHGGVTVERQLAPGTSRGSRHCVEGDITVYLPAQNSGQLTGPIISAHDRFTVTHPEHAHFSLPAGFYRVTYQRDFNIREVSRVAD
ncbi:MAG: hypothetical protein H6839_13135 [Planctomycetes bacterium]|nr:hypothetical protein [Planctomycetota bacterium]